MDNAEEPKVVNKGNGCRWKRKDMIVDLLTII